MRKLVIDASGGGLFLWFSEVSGILPLLPSYSARRSDFIPLVSPNAGQPGHEALITELKSLFANYQTGGFVSLEYQTRVYHGRFDA